jgi:hypothetical protein
VACTPISPSNKIKENQKKLQTEKLPKTSQCIFSMTNIATKFIIDKKKKKL